MDEKTISAISAVQKLFKPRHDLLEGLLVNCRSDSNGVEMYCGI